MIRSIEYSELRENADEKSYVIIDVRSPGEYKNATIPGAINIPLFNDEERKIIGTVYVNESIEKAKRIGVEYISRRLPEIYDRVSELNQKYDKLIFFCERGGMRSSSLVSLLIALGINAYKIMGGYKGYRTFINKELPKVVEGIRFVVLYGNTGTGKTKLLKKLRERGFDTLDLEDCAKHRGSLLGSIGIGEQNSQKMFESLVYESLRSRKDGIVFVEGESKRIGKIIMPEFLFNTIENGGIAVKIVAGIETRIQNIYEDYIYDNMDELIEGLNLLRKHINDRKINEYIDLIRNNRFNEVIEDLMIKYYDPMYQNNKRDYSLTVNNDDIGKACNVLIEWSNENIVSCGLKNIDDK